jgi:hypothetical protein
MLGLPTKRPVGPEGRRVNIARAERIAMHRVRGGQLSAEELRMQDGRLTWMIDVQFPNSRDLAEIDIDAMDGHIIAGTARIAGRGGPRGSSPQSWTPRSKISCRSRDNWMSFWR